VQNLHIGIDASRSTVARRTGTESYAFNLIRAMLRMGATHRFTLYFRDAPAPDLLGRNTHATHKVMPVLRLWTHLRLSWELLITPHKPDALFVPAHVLPLIHPLPSVVTIHDLGYRYFPEAHPFGQRLYLDWSTRFSARAATRVIADSQATAHDLGRFYNIPADKITVVYPGRDESLTRVDPASVCAKYQLPENYLLHVGTLQPRKNLIRLMEAISGQRSAVSLVLAGRAGWLSAPIMTLAKARGVRVLDYVPDEDLAGLYSGAAAFVFPSLYEGFGFPVLEALACGVPVICSNTSSLPEVAGAAAVLVDPLDTHAISAAINRVLADADLRAILIRRGYEQIQKFSWEKAARETLTVLEEAFGRQ
jgi:glycosyltransferase involved in cell wall biosynthesis